MTIDSFTPDLGQILLEPIPNNEMFASKKPDEDNPGRIAKVLKIGMGFVNDFGIKREQPCMVGDTVFYDHEYHTPELEINSVKYPVVPFNKIRGIFRTK